MCCLAKWPANACLELLLMLEVQTIVDAIMFPTRMETLETMKSGNESY